MAVAYLTPRYETGTVDVSAADPAVVTQDTGSTLWQTNNIKAGDKMFFGSTGERDPTETWYTVDTVDSETQITLLEAVVGAPLTAQAQLANSDHRRTR